MRRSGVIGWVSGLMALLLLLAPLASAESGDVRDREQLAFQLDRALKTRAFRGARVAALVVRDGDGAILYQKSPDDLLIPASNAKLLTSLAMLDAYGPSHQFETLIWSDRPPDEKGAVGTLGVRGSGDPAINSEDWWRIAARLRANGLRRVVGDLVLDESMLDRVRWNPTLKGLSSRAYHAPVGAINANYGSFEVIVGPGEEVGKPPVVEVLPRVPYLQIANTATTVAAGKRRRLVVDRSAGERGEVVSVSGSLRLGDAPKSYYRSVLDPALYAGAVFRMQLEANGIEVAGQVRLGPTPADAHELYTFEEGRAMSETIRLFMKYSNNVIGETLVKDLGARETGTVGSWENGVPAMRQRLIRLGIEPGSFRLVDGSGLSYENRVSPRALVRALVIARSSFQYSPEFWSAMPIAGRDGTLKKRAANALDEVRGKTGLLNNTTALSGYAKHPIDASGSERELVLFSIIVNDYRVPDDDAMRAVDGFVEVLTSP